MAITLGSSGNWTPMAAMAPPILTELAGWETFSNIPTEGVVYMSYKCAPEDRNFKVLLGGELGIGPVKP